MRIFPEAVFLYKDGKRYIDEEDSNIWPGYAEKPDVDFLILISLAAGGGVEF